MSGSLRTSNLAAAYYRLMQRFLIPRLPVWGLTPNRLTWMGMLISLTVPLGFWAHPLLGFGLILASGLADSLDGLMARHQKKSSSWGAFLDSTLDRISDCFYLLGFWVPLSRNMEPLWATVSIFVCLLLTVLISYAKCRAEALGCPCPACCRHTKKSVCGWAWRSTAPCHWLRLSIAAYISSDILGTR